MIFVYYSWTNVSLKSYLGKFNNAFPKQLQVLYICAEKGVRFKKLMSFNLSSKSVKGCYG